MEDSSDVFLTDNRAEVLVPETEIKEWKKIAQKAASPITQTVDDSIVISLDVHHKNPCLMWANRAAGYNTVTPAIRSMARKEFLNFSI